MLKLVLYRWFWLVLLCLPLPLISCGGKQAVRTEKIMRFTDACASPHEIETVRYYVEHNLDTQQGLIVAAGQNPNVKVIKVLLKSKNLTKGTKTTALFYSIRNPNPAVCRVLIKAGADVNARNLAGETPLSLAKELGREDIVLILQKAGAKNYLHPDTRWQTGWNTLFCMR